MPGSIQHLDHGGGAGALPTGGAEADFAREVASLQTDGGATGATDPAAVAYQAVEKFLAENITLFAPQQMADQTNFDVTKTSVGKMEDGNQVG